MTRIGLGLDTGGTFTDAVLLDIDSGRILARSKSMTTHDDLSRGIRGAIEGFDRDLLRKTDVVSLSTTLATNSVVEGRGCRVALVVMGHELTVPVKADYTAYVSGSYRASGREDEPLDLEAVRTFLESVRGKVDSVAITGFMSIRNPDHENAVKAMASDILGVPAVCGHELSSSLGFNERTTTCVMNARLIPIIGRLLDSVDAVMEESGIDAPLLVVKGDGSIMSEDMARERPVETILSGPASSINGARRLSGLDDAIVVDIGGTTTDVGVIRDGRVHLEEEGALIGGFRTRVAAADIATAGLGGDSRIVVNGKIPSLSTVKVTPLCVAATRYPVITEWLRLLVARGPRDVDYANYQRNLVMDTEYFIRLGGGEDGDLTDLDRRFLEFVDGTPHSMADARWEFGEPAVSFHIETMENRRMIQRIGLTPTDLMHYRGTFTRYDAEASKLAIMYHAANMGITPDEFVDRIDAMIQERIGTTIVRKLMTEGSDRALEGYGDDLVRDGVNEVRGRDFDVRFRLNKPIVGLGGPSYDMLPRVAAALGTELVLPRDYDIGNAVGAISGKVVESIQILIQSVLGKELATNACIVFSRLGRKYYTSFEEGLEEARREGIEYVREMAIRAGADDVAIEEFCDSKKVSVGEEQFRTDATEVRLTIRATGDPRYRRRFRSSCDRGPRRASEHLSRGPCRSACHGCPSRPPGACWRICRSGARCWPPCTPP